MFQPRTICASPRLHSRRSRPQLLPCIDVHQHANYVDRRDPDLFEHQRRLGVATTILLPAGSRYGLAAKAAGNETVLRVAQEQPGFAFFANEITDHPDSGEVISRFLRAGAIGIGEQKFEVSLDSPEEIARKIFYRNACRLFGFDERAIEHDTSVGVIGRPGTPET